MKTLNLANLNSNPPLRTQPFLLFWEILSLSSLFFHFTPFSTWLGLSENRSEYGGGWRQDTSSECSSLFPRRWNDLLYGFKHEVRSRQYHRCCHWSTLWILISLFKMSTLCGICFSFPVFLFSLLDSMEKLGIVVLLLPFLYSLSALLLKISDLFAQGMSSRESSLI